MQETLNKAERPRKKNQKGILKVKHLMNEIKTTQTELKWENIKSD